MPDLFGFGGGGGGGATSLNDLLDVTITGTPGAGELLVNDGAGQFVNQLLNLNDLGDVNVGTPGPGEDGYVLQWNDAAGEFDLTPAGGSGVSALNDLTDVDAPSPTTGDFLQFNGGTGNWESTAVAPGSGAGGAGVAGQVAFWTAPTILGGDTALLWDSANNVLKINTTTAGQPGSLFLPPGIGGSVYWPVGISGMGFYAENIGGIDSYVFRNGNFGIDFTQDVVSGSDVNWRFRTQGVGHANVHVEGTLAIFNSDNFGGNAPWNVISTIAIALDDDNTIAWSPRAGLTNVRQFGLTDDNSWGFTHNIGTNYIQMTNLLVGGGGSLDWRFKALGTTKMNLVCEGYLEVHDTNDFGATMPNQGFIRLPNDAGIAGARNGGAVDFEMVKIGTNNRLRLYGAADWPATNGAGVLVNNGSGDLSWSSSGALDLNDLGDVNITSPANLSLLNYNSTTMDWEDITPATLFGAMSISDLSDVDTTGAVNGNVLQLTGGTWVDATVSTILSSGNIQDLGNVTGTPTAGNFLLGTGPTWVSTPASTAAAQFDLGDLGDVTISSPAALDLVRRNAGNTGWENVTVATFLGGVDLQDLANVDAPADDDILQYDLGSNTWQTVPIPAPSLTLGGLTNVAAAVDTATNGSVLQRVAGTWTAVAENTIKAYRGAVATLPAAGTTNPLGWVSEIIDTDAIHNTVTNNARLTVPTGVTRVRITCNLQWSTGTIGDAILQKNGSDLAIGGGGFRLLQDLTASSLTTVSGLSPALIVTGGDYFQIRINGGGTPAQGTFEMEILE